MLLTLAATALCLMQCRDSGLPEVPPPVIPVLDIEVFHEAVRGKDGGLRPWHSDGDGPFHHIITLQAEWWLEQPDHDGWPVCCTAAKLDRGCGQFGGAVPASTCSLGILAMLKYHEYAGDGRALELARRLGAYQLERGLTPSDIGEWADFPWPAGATGDTCPDGGGHPFCTAGEVMPDKGAMVGWALVRLYETTGEQAWLDGSVRIADTLARHAAPGDGSRSPWPFRVRADSGVQVDGPLSGNQVFALRLFDGLLRLGVERDGYREAREAVWRWLRDVAIADTSGGSWQHFFEDHSGDEDNPTQFSALETARYLLEERERLDPHWLELALAIEETVRRRWVVERDGCFVVGEQQQDMTPYNSHTARYGSLLAMLHAATGEERFRDEAFSCLCYAAYSVDNDGFTDTSYGKGTAWTTDSFGDWLRSFIDALAAVPRWGRPAS